MTSVNGMKILFYENGFETSNFVGFLEHFTSEEMAIFAGDLIVGDNEIRYRIELMAINPAMGTVKIFVKVG